MFRLKLSKLSWIAPVDDPAQESATALLLKRKGAPGVQATAKVVKLSDGSLLGAELGLVFGWAATPTWKGKEYFDLHDDNIVEEDLIKVALEYVKSGAKSDEMHNRVADGWVPFVMPMTAEVAKAFGIKTDTTGLMIAMQPSAEVFAKFKSGEYTGFSIDGEGYRAEVTTKGAVRVAKSALFTDEVDGHQHVIWIYDDGCCTSYATATDSEFSHNHQVVRGDDGSLKILADSGHTHVLAEGQPAVVVVPVDAVVVVQAHAPERAQDRASKNVNSTTGSAVRSVTSTKANEGPTMKTDAEKLADLQKRYDRFLKMSGHHKVYFDTLGDDDARDAFLAKSFSEREAAIKLADEANPVVYTSKTTKKAYRASDEASGLVEMAKQIDAQAEELAKSRLDAENVEFEKHAATKLSKLGGDLKIRTYIVKAIKKGGGDEATVKAALEALDTAQGALAQLEKSSGTTGGVGDEPTNTDGDPLVKWNAKVAEFAKSKDLKDLGKAEDMFLDTPAGLAAKREYDATRSYGK